MVVSPTPYQYLRALSLASPAHYVGLPGVSPTYRRTHAALGSGLQLSVQNYDPRMCETTRLKRNRSILNHLLPIKPHNPFILSEYPYWQLWFFFLDGGKKKKEKHQKQQRQQLEQR